MESAWTWCVYGTYLERTVVAACPVCHQERINGIRIRHITLHVELVPLLARVDLFAHRLDPVVRLTHVDGGEAYHRWTVGKDERGRLLSLHVTLPRDQHRLLWIPDRLLVMFVLGDTKIDRHPTVLVRRMRVSGVNLALIELEIPVHQLRHDVGGRVPFSQNAKLRNGGVRPTPRRRRRG